MSIAKEYPTINSTTMLLKCSIKNEHVAKEPNFKVYFFMKINNEN